jgi:Ca-activated chloride channel family protein
MGWTFNNYDYLYLLWLVPLAVVLYCYGFVRKRRALERFATPNLIGQLMPQVSTARQKVKAGLAVAALAMVALALAGPRWGQRDVEVYQRGVEVMVVLDVSRSMLADDCRPSRLEKAKQLVNNLLEELPGDRVGLVVFAGQARLACPLTPNYGWLRMALEEAAPGTVAQGGSNLAEAIRIAGGKLRQRPGDHKAILLITDGEDHDTDPQYAARYVFDDYGVRTFAIGLGDPTTGRRILVRSQDGRKEYIEDQDGREHYSRMNATALEAVASAGGNGFAVPAGTADVDMADFYERMVARLDPEAFEMQRREQQIERYQWFAAVALVLLLVETLMTDRRRTPTPALQRQVAA